jgi:hypothetical protein
VATPAAADLEPWTTRRLLARHKRAAWAVAAFVALMVAMALVTLLGSRGGAVSDATTCTQWGSATQDQQTAYARLYVREHGALRNGETAPASVIAAVNNGCSLAFTNDVSDTMTVVQAISGKL